MSEVGFQRIALFGKGAANQDYAWLHGRDDIPPELREACEYLSRAANEMATSLSAVASLPDSIYLLRAFPQGIDTSFRPSFALEVGRVHSPQPLAAEHLLGLAWLATRESWAEGCEGEGEIRLKIPVLQDERVELDRDLSLRARLGLPLSAPGVLEALALLRAFPRRYRGLAFAPRLRGGAVPWNRQLASLLAIQFDAADLDELDSKLLAYAIRHPPTEEEWQALDELETSEVHRILLWAAQGKGRFPGSARNGSTAWLIAHRRSQSQGVSLLAALRADLGLEVLPQALLGNALPGLSPEALATLARYEAGEECPLGPDVLGELARSGLLGEGSPIPPKAWLPVASAVEDASRAALDLLRARGVEESAARWLLADPAGSVPRRLSETASAVAVARELGIAMPLAALWDLVDQMGPSDLESLGTIAGGLGVQGTTLFHLLRSGTLPPAGVLLPEDLVRGLAARYRVAGNVDVGAVLRGLLEQERTEEARAVLAAGDILPSLSPTVVAILEARLEGRPPVEVATSEGLLGPAQSGLIRPCDVVPRAEETSFLELAAIWPETASLAAVLRREPMIPSPQCCPPLWRTALQRILDRDRVLRWLERWRGGDLTAPRLWLCEILELPPAVQRLAAGMAGGDSIEAAEVRASLPWLALLFRADRIDHKLGLVAQLARGGGLTGEDRLAAAFVGEMLVEAEPAIRELCVHLLSRIGPMPPISSIAPHLLATLTPAAEPIALVDTLFSTAGAVLTRDSTLIDAVVARVQEAGVPCPSRRYTAGQLERHGRLACRLARLAGWECVALDEPTRRRIARHLLADLDLPCPADWGEEPAAEKAAGASAPATEEARDAAD